MAPSVGVIGLGIMGAMTAWRLAERGFEVHGYEQFGIGHDRGASSGQSRRFSLHSQRQIGFTPLAREALGLWRELEATAGASLLLTTGGLIIGPPASGPVTTAIESAERYGLPYEVLSAEEMRRRYPPFRIGAEHVGVFDPEAGVIRPERSLLTAIRRAAALGATFHDRTRIDVVEPFGAGVTVRTSSGTHRHDYVVVTTGSWAGELLPSLADRVSPRLRVQTWFLADDPDAFSPSRFPAFDLVEPVPAFGLPTLDGSTVKVAFTLGDHAVVEDLNHPDRHIVPALLDEIATHVAGLIDGLHPYPVATSVAIEGYTRDNAPIVGADAGCPRLISAVGFSGSGFKFSPIVGELIAEAIAGEAPRREVGFLRPDRDLSTWDDI